MRRRLLVIMVAASSCWIAIESPQRNARSASVMSTCVRARMSAERACAKNLLGRGDVQQVPNTVVVGLKGGGIGLAGRLQQRGGGLALAKRRLQIRIRCPNFVLDAIARSADLRLRPCGFRLPPASKRLRRAPPSNTVQFKLRATPPVKSAVCPQRQRLLLHVKRLGGWVSSQIQARIVRSPRLLPLRLRLADAGQVRLEVRPLLESAINRLLDCSRRSIGSR